MRRSSLDSGNRLIGHFGVVRVRRLCWSLSRGDKLLSSHICSGHLLLGLNHLLLGLNHLLLGLGARLLVVLHLLLGLGARLLVVLHLLLGLGARLLIVLHLLLGLHLHGSGLRLRLLLASALLFALLLLLPTWQGKRTAVVSSRLRYTTMSSLSSTSRSWNSSSCIIILI